MDFLVLRLQLTEYQFDRPSGLIHRCDIFREELLTREIRDVEVVVVGVLVADADDTERLRIS